MNVMLSRLVKLAEILMFFFSISFLENEWKDKMIKSIVSNSINKTLP